jgi:hypothetical protein
VNSIIGAGVKIGIPPTIRGFTVSDVTHACDYNVGVGNLEQKPRIKVYPNPANSAINIQINAEIFGPLTYEILDIQGRVVTSGFITNGEGKINLTPFSQGLFVLKLKSNSGLETRRFVKL